MKFSLLDGLNPEQREAAMCKTHCLAVAAPGSGKTKMLAAKAAFLLSDGISTVVAVTFTRASANELKERIVQQAGTAAMGRLLVGTFHSINQRMAFPSRPTSMGKQILAGMKSPFKRPWNIAPTGVLTSHVINSVKEVGLEMDFRDATKIIEASKANRKLPDDERESQLVQIYGRHLLRHDQIDMQDIMLLVNEAMQSGTLRPMPVNYLLLDEYQDTDRIQFEWASMHGSGGTHLTCVGDDDQSIYGFRNALGNAGMDMFVQQFRAPRIILGVNYRCREEVLGAAGHLIAHNKDRVDKVLFANKGYGGEVVWDRFKDREYEAHVCALFAGRASAASASCAVIARTNKRLDEVESRLIKLDVKYQRTDSKSILESPEFALYKALVECLVKPTANSMDLLLSWSGVSEIDLNEIHKLFGTEFHVGTTKEYELSHISPDGKKKWRSLSKYVSEWEVMAAANNYLLMFPVLTLWLYGFTTSKMTQTLISIVAIIFTPKAGQSLAERLTDINKAMLARKNSKEESTALISLMTAHGSKGLEFDRVWILGAEETVFPDESASIEEERRLMYVAITRAREQLVISCSGTKSTPSRFIDEARIQRAEVGRFKNTVSPN